MQDEREDLFREEEQEWQEKWFDTPGDVDDFIFYSGGRPREGRGGAGGTAPVVATTANMPADRIFWFPEK